MNNEFSNSSDGMRSATPLEYAQTVTFDAPLELERGGSLSEVTVVYETYGQLSSARDNAVLICHALSGDSHVTRHDDADGPGWWDIVVGPGKAIDTDRYFVICPNILGSCRGTTGPGSIDPATGRPYGRDFPAITVGDMVEVQRRLVDHLEIDQLLSVVGGSLGGHQALCWGQRYPQRVAGVIAIATSPRLTSQALAFDVVGRNAILRDPNYREGAYYDGGPGPDVGLAIARMIGHITYLSPESMKAKFDLDRLRPRDVPTEFEKRFSVGSYLGYLGDKFVERFDANSYNALTMAMDMFDLGSGEALASALGGGDCRWLVLSFTSDWLFPPAQSQEIVDALVASGKSVSYCNVASKCGHDAFLLAEDLDSYGELMRAFLDNLRAEVSPVHTPDLDEDTYGVDATSIYHGRRVDYDRILELIGDDASVLDVGCGAGGLLARLAERRGPRSMGVELDEQAILTCMRRGLDVVQANLNDGLDSFADGQFDTVVLSQTLQAVFDVEAVLDGILRVGRQSIVSFPNYGYQKLRDYLSEWGRAPKASGLLRFEWYNTMNIRFFTILDFTEYCRAKKITIHRRIALDTETGLEVTEDPNRNADLAIFVISR